MPFGDLWKLPEGVRPATANIPGADPRANLSGFQRMNYDLQYRPEAIQALGAGIASGDNAQGWLDHAKVSSGFRRDDAEMAEKQHNQAQLEQYLLGMGMSPEQARAAATNENVASHLFRLEEIKAQEEAKALNPENPGVFQPRIYARPKADGSGTDYIEVQPSQDGSGLVDVYGNPVRQEDGWVPYDPARKAGDMAREKAFGENEADLGARYGELRSAIDTIDEIYVHPGLDKYTGPLYGRTPDISAGAVAFTAVMEKLHGQAFLAARQRLKGGGSITDMEGQKAEQALLAIKPTMDAADIRNQLAIARDHLMRGFALLDAGAGKAPTDTSIPSATPGSGGYSSPGDPAPAPPTKPRWQEVK